MALVAGTGLAAIAGAGSAAASPVHQLHVWKTLPGDYVGPLQFAVSGRTVAVADSFTSSLYLVGHTAPIAIGFPPTQTEENSGDLAGVDIRNGAIAYTTTKADHLRQPARRARPRPQGAPGEPRAHTSSGTTRTGAITYGVTDPSSGAARATRSSRRRRSRCSYTGEKDSHPYAVAGLRDGSWLVADAGGNDILRVDPMGHISTFAVLPAQPLTITKRHRRRRRAWPTAPAAPTASKRCRPTSRSPNSRSTSRRCPATRSDGRVYHVGWNGHLHRLAGGIPDADEPRGHAVRQHLRRRARHRDLLGDAARAAGGRGAAERRSGGMGERPPVRLDGAGRREPGARTRLPATS